MKIKIRKTQDSDRSWMKSVFQKRWSSDFIVTRGKIHKSDSLDGFIAEVQSKRKGLITFKVNKRDLEIISLDSFLKRKGVGSALLRQTIILARKKQLKRVWLVTTNDNLVALRFYQKRGLVLKKLYPNALELTRRLKPNVPFKGNNGIPLRDEIELEKKF